MNRRNRPYWLALRDPWLAILVVYGLVIIFNGWFPL